MLRLKIQHWILHCFYNGYWSKLYLHLCYFLVLCTNCKSRKCNQYLWRLPQSLQIDHWWIWWQNCTHRRRIAEFKRNISWYRVCLSHCISFCWEKTYSLREESRLSMDNISWALKSKSTRDYESSYQEWSTSRWRTRSQWT